MHEYPHIDTIFKRDERGQIIEDQFSVPEFDFLKDNGWVGTEKVDGTNIRVMWDGEMLRFGGKTDRAQIPATLIEALQDTFPVERLRSVFEGPVCLYGEGYGARIQKGGGNYRPDQGFVLFDVKVGDWWLKRESLVDIADRLQIAIVPVVFEGTLAEAVEIVHNGLRSTWGEFQAEGLVLKPAVDLLSRNGNRVITKIKTRDFK